MAHDGFAGTIRPVHLDADEDTVFCLARGEVKVSTDALGYLGAYMMAMAINDALRSAKTAYGTKAVFDLCQD